MSAESAVPSGSRPRDNRFHYRDAAALRTKARDLGVDLPWSDDIAPLLSSLTLGGWNLPNRLVVHPMEGCDSELSGGPSDQTLRRYERYATGGAGLIWVEATAVVPDGRANPRQLHLHQDSAAGFAKLVSATRKAAHAQFGPGHTPLLVLQLTHSGRWSRPDGTRRPVIAHHNPYLDELVGIDADFPLLADDDLSRLQDAFLAATHLAVEAGFDGVDVKACHGYLCAELLAAHTREGGYGGSFAHRSRWLLETVHRIRGDSPGLLVTSRVSAYDGVPHPFGFGVDRDDPSRPDLAEPRELLRSLHGAGCPLASVSIGVPYRQPHLGRPFDRPVADTAPSPEHPLVGVTRLIGIVSDLQAAVPELPLVGTGYSWLRHHFPNVGAGAVAAGLTALVGVGRMAFAYPDFGRDLYEHGALDFLKSCCACSGCTQLMRADEPAGCVVRDQAVYRLPRRPRGSKAL